MQRFLRRVAVIGGARIPFCRSNTLLCRSVQPRPDDRRTQRARRSLQPEGPAHRRGRRRRGRHAFEGLQPDARGHPRHEAQVIDAGHHHDAGLRHQPAGRAGQRRQDRDRRDRLRHCRRLRHDLGRAHRRFEEAGAAPDQGRATKELHGQAEGVQRLCAGRAGALRRPPTPSRAPACRWASTPN